MKDEFEEEYSLNWENIDDILNKSYKHYIEQQYYSTFLDESMFNTISEFIKEKCYE